jgi:hypothetical protein
MKTVKQNQRGKKTSKNATEKKIPYSKQRAGNIALNVELSCFGFAYDDKSL